MCIRREPMKGWWRSQRYRKRRGIGRMLSIVETTTRLSGNLLSSDNNVVTLCKKVRWKVGDSVSQLHGSGREINRNLRALANQIDNYTFVGNWNLTKIINLIFIHCSWYPLNIVKMRWHRLKIIVAEILEVLLYREGLVALRSRSLVRVVKREKEMWRQEVGILRTRWIWREIRRSVDRDPP